MKTAFSTKNITAFIAVTLVAGSITFGVTKGRSFFREHRPNKLAAYSNTRPSLVLWAWERPTDLTFIDPGQTAVAFLARTIHLRGDEVVTRPRLQPLKLPERVTVVAVARVESDATKKPRLSNEQESKLVASITEMASLANVSGIQIDFDATKSERSFYREVIIGVRRRLPERIGLSITALASWTKPCRCCFEWRLTGSRSPTGWMTARISLRRCVAKATASRRMSRAKPFLRRGGSMCLARTRGLRVRSTQLWS